MSRVTRTDQKRGSRVVSSLVELHPWIGRVQLQIERRSLHSLLFLARECGEAMGKGVGDAKFHLGFG